MTFSEVDTSQLSVNSTQDANNVIDNNNDNFWKLSTFFMINVTVLLITLATLFLYVFLPTLTAPPSLSCGITPPVVDQVLMHQEIRKLLIDEKFSNENGAILMHGGYVTYRYDTDVEEDFRQESNFWYVTGYDQPNGTIVLDLLTGYSYFFIPLQPLDYAVWNGKIETPESVKAAYGFDEVHYQVDLAHVLSVLSNNYDPSYVIYIYDSVVQFPNKDLYTVNDSKLSGAIGARRAVKTESELQLMRYTAKVSSDAHRLVMNHTTYGNYEYNAEGKFLDGCFACGLTVQSYLPICASGNNSAILHYNDNNKLMTNGEFLLIDAGAEYFGYAADITRTYPVNGTFTSDQALVYNMVLNTQNRVINSLRVGKAWSSLQTDCKFYICEELVNNGFLLGTASICRNLDLSYYFFPHGVSHMLGLDVHDPRDPTSYNLVAGNVLTVEPGIYFNNALFEIAFADPSVSQYMVKEKIVPLLESQFGGVRIEDIVAIHENSVEMLSDAPRTIFEIESLMNARG